MPLGFVSAAAQDRATHHIRSNHSVNTCTYPIPTHLGKVHKRALIVPPSSPYQRVFVCGTCAGTTQVGVSLVSLFDPIFIRSRLHCLDVCLTWYLWHVKVWWRYLHWQCGHHPGTLPYLCVSDETVLLKIWWWCIHNFPESGTLVHIV